MDVWSSVESTCRLQYKCTRIYLHNVVRIFVLVYMTVKSNVCRAVLLVTLLTIVCSYEVYILTLLSDISIWTYFHVWHLRAICISGTHLAIMCNVPVVDFLFGFVCVVIWDLYIDHNSSAVDHSYVVMGIFVQAYANDVKCMYICVPGHIVNCTGFRWSIYTNIVVSCVHMN